MKWRYGFLLVCAALTAMAGATVVSGREAPWICCESATGCGQGEVCCDPDGLGTPPCSEELGGFCMEVCKRPAAPTFTPDQK